MKLHINALWVTAAGLAIASTAHAQQSTDQPGSQPSLEFATLDKNKDGFVSRQEAQADKNVAALFNRADTNHDGKLTEDELTKARAAQDRERAARVARDTEITTKIKAELLTKKGFPSTGVSVETTQGVVKLSGTVEQAGQIKEAGTVAAKVKGVKKVENTLKVK